MRLERERRQRVAAILRLFKFWRIDGELIRLRAAGLTHKQIADLYGVTRGAIYGRLKAARDPSISRRRRRRLLLELRDLGGAW